MSNLKELILDFDISGPPVQRKVRPSEKQQETVAPREQEVVVPVVDEKSDLKKNTLTHTPTAKFTFDFHLLPQVHATRKKIKLGFVLLLLIFVFALHSFLEFFSVNEKSPHATCAHAKGSLSCHFACGLRSDCDGDRVVVFHSRGCADSVRVVRLHFHQHYERIPAYVLRIKNTTSFEVAGGRVVFSPCDSTCSVSVRKIPHRKKTSPEFRNKLVWVATEKEKVFELRQSGHLLATVEAEAVLYAEINSLHRVYSFPLRCDATVRVFDKYTGREIESFNYCESTQSVQSS